MARTKPRKLLELTFDPLYTSRGRCGDPCTYCGQVSDTMDHVPPLNQVAALSSADADYDGRFLKVPACHECNSILGTYPKLTIRERRDHVRKHLRKKYRRFLAIPNWDEDELAELSPSFAQEVRASVSFANHVRTRLRWMR